MSRPMTPISSVKEKSIKAISCLVEGFFFLIEETVTILYLQFNLYKKKSMLNFRKSNLENITIALTIAF